MASSSCFKYKSQEQNHFNTVGSVLTQYFLEVSYFNTDVNMKTFLTIIPTNLLLSLGQLDKKRRKKTYTSVEKA